MGLRSYFREHIEDTDMPLTYEAECIRSLHYVLESY